MIQIKHRSPFFSSIHSSLLIYSHFLCKLQQLIFFHPLHIKTRGKCEQKGQLKDVSHDRPPTNWQRRHTSITQPSHCLLLLKRVRGTWRFATEMTSSLAYLLSSIRFCKVTRVNCSCSTVCLNKASK